MKKIVALDLIRTTLMRVQVVFHSSFNWSYLYLNLYLIFDQNNSQLIIAQRVTQFSSLNIAFHIWFPIEFDSHIRL